MTRRHAQALWLLATGLLFAGLLVARRPEILTQPQLYAEDGEWFQAAHGAGLAALVAPGAGYLVVFIRLVALLTAPLQLANAARAYAAIGIAMQVLPALFLASPRLRNVMPDDRLRLLIALIFILVPNAELTGNLTNTQWHLALLGFLVLVAVPPTRRWQRAFDLITLVLAGLTGPFALLLLPLGAIYHRRHIDSWRRTELAILAVCAFAQLATLLATHGAARSDVPLGASPSSFVFALANQVLFRFVPITLSDRESALAAVVAFAVGLILLAGAWRGCRDLRYFCAFAVAVAVAGMFFPEVGPHDSQPAWVAIGQRLTGARYFFFLVLAVILCLLSLASSERWRVTTRRWAVAGVVAGLLLAAAGEWRYAPITGASVAVQVVHAPQTARPNPA